MLVLRAGPRSSWAGEAKIATRHFENRENWLINAGYRVLLFSNDQVKLSLEEVMAKILNEIKSDVT